MTFERNKKNWISLFRHRRVVGRLIHKQKLIHKQITKKTKECLRHNVWWICKTIRISETQSHGFQVTTTTTTTLTRPRLTSRRLTPHSLQLQVAIMSIASSSKTSSRSSLSSSPSLYCLSLYLILFILVCFLRILG